MHAAFPTVIWVVCLVSLVLAFAALLTSRKTWEDFGKNRLSLDSDLRSAGRPAAAVSVAERDSEIRQMLEARNARRARRGEAPIDIEQELARLTAPQVDAELRSEIRDLVIARNHRRARQGKPPLDVEAEVERQIAALSSL